MATHGALTEFDTFNTALYAMLPEVLAKLSLIEASMRAHMQTCPRGAGVETASQACQTEDPPPSPMFHTANQQKFCQPNPAQLDDSLIHSTHSEHSADASFVDSFINNRDSSVIEAVHDSSDTGIAAAELIHAAQATCGAVFNHCRQVKQEPGAAETVEFKVDIRRERLSADDDSSYPILNAAAASSTSHAGLVPLFPATFPAEERSLPHMDLSDHATPATATVSSTDGAAASGFDVSPGTSKPKVYKPANRKRVNASRNPALYVLSSERPYRCENCMKTFKSVQHYKNHSLIHAGYRPYKCERCGMCFTQRHSLVTHERIHSGEKPFDCQMCGKKFRHTQGLYRHVRCMHGEPVVYVAQKWRDQDDMITEVVTQIPGQPEGVNSG